MTNTPQVCSVSESTNLFDIKNVQATRPASESPAASKSVNVNVIRLLPYMAVANVIRNIQISLKEFYLSNSVVSTIKNVNKIASLSYATAIYIYKKTAKSLLTIYSGYSLNTLKAYPKTILALISNKLSLRTTYNLAWTVLATVSNAVASVGFGRVFNLIYAASPVIKFNRAINITLKYVLTTVCTQLRTWIKTVLAIASTIVYNLVGRVVNIFPTLQIYTLITANRNINKIYSYATSSILTIIRGIQKTINYYSSTLPVVIRSISKILSSIVTIVLSGGKTLNKILLLLETNYAIISNQIGKLLTATETGQPMVVRSIGKTFNIQPIIVINFTKLFSRSILVSEVIIPGLTLGFMYVRVIKLTANSLVSAVKNIIPTQILSTYTTCLTTILRNWGIPGF